MVSLGCSGLWPPMPAAVADSRLVLPSFCLPLWPPHGIRLSEARPMCRIADSRVCVELSDSSPEPRLIRHLGWDPCRFALAMMGGSVPIHVIDPRRQWQFVDMPDGPSLSDRHLTPSYDPGELTAQSSEGHWTQISRSPR